MRLLLRLLPLIALIFLLPSCSIIEPPAQVPSFVHIDSIAFTSDYSTQGTNSHKIKDAWFYVDQNLVGVFQLPATIPVLGSGNHQIDVKPGIMINGIASTRGAYPFYNFYTTTINLVEQNVTTISPTVSYYSGTQFSWMEDFDKTGMTMHAVKPSMDSLERISGGAMEGINSAHASLNDTNYYFECATINSYSLPTDGSHTVYLEMNYKGTNTFRVGIMHVSSSSGLPEAEDTVLDVRPSATWNKIYVDLTSVCGGYPSSNGYGSFYIFIAAVLDPGMTNSEIYFDNLKLIHQ